MLTQALLCWRVMVANAKWRGERILSTYDFTPRDARMFDIRNERLRTERMKSKLLDQAAMAAKTTAKPFTPTVRSG